MTTDGSLAPMVVVGVAAAFFAGAALGCLYFLGLWYTVRRQARLRHPTPWLLLSLFGRLALLLAGFYFVMSGSWQRLLACVVGFIVARLVMTRLLGSGTGGTVAAGESSQ